MQRPNKPKRERSDSGSACPDLLDSSACHPEFALLDA